MRGTRTPTPVIRPPIPCIHMCKVGLHAPIAGSDVPMPRIRACILAVGQGIADLKKSLLDTDARPVEIANELPKNCQKD